MCIQGTSLSGKYPVYHTADPPEKKQRKILIFENRKKKETKPKPFCNLVWEGMS